MYTFPINICTHTLPEHLQETESRDDLEIDEVTTCVLLSMKASPLNEEYSVF
jgi:hypothetical protein